MPTLITGATHYGDSQAAVQRFGLPPEIWAKIQAVPKEALLNLSSLPPDDPIYQNDYLIFFPASPSIGGTPASPLPPPPAAPER